MDLHAALLLAGLETGAHAGPVSLTLAPHLGIDFRESRKVNAVRRKHGVHLKQVPIHRIEQEPVPAAFGFTGIDRTRAAFLVARHRLPLRYHAVQQGEPPIAQREHREQLVLEDL